MTDQRKAATISLIPEAQRTAALPSVKRAGEEGGCGEVLCATYRIINDITHCCITSSDHTHRKKMILYVSRLIIK